MSLTYLPGLIIHNDKFIVVKNEKANGRYMHNLFYTTSVDILKKGSPDYKTHVNTA